jgi:Trypsin-like peptidase domain
MEVDQFSLTTVPVELFYKQTPLGIATSFVWKHADGRYFLITNWHVVSGRDAITRKNLKAHGGRPDRIHAYFNFQIGIFGKAEVDINIRDDHGTPRWLIHPIQGAAVDVVAIPLPYTGNETSPSLYPLNPLSAQGLVIRVSMEVFILGYPFGPEPPGFPVWKRGSIAAEPDLVRSGPQYLLVDTASLPGMSGSPVIRRSWTNHMVNSNFTSDDSRPATKLIGVYSGRRLGPHRRDTQLGMVWPESFISEIIIGNMRDDDSRY